MTMPGNPKRCRSRSTESGRQCRIMKSVKGGHLVHHWWNAKRGEWWSGAFN